jgi:hypothetical protein
MDITDIRRQAQGLEIDVEIDENGFLNMRKRGGGSPRFASLQEYDNPHVLRAAQEWLNRYRDLLNQLDHR